MCAIGEVEDVFGALADGGDLGGVEQDAALVEDAANHAEQARLVGRDQLQHGAAARALTGGGALQPTLEVRAPAFINE